MKKWVYAHIGKKLALYMTPSPHLKPKFCIKGCHNLEVYLHLIDGFHSEGSRTFREAERDIALVNKTTGMLKKKLRIPKKWCKAHNYKGLVFNRATGRGVKPGK